MDSIGDLLKKKADEIDDSGISDDLKIIQEELDRHFEGKLHATKLDDKGVLLVSTRSSSVASDARMKSFQIIRNLKHSTKNELTRIRIRIQ